MSAMTCWGEPVPLQESAYRYETRATKQQPNRERHRHVAALLSRNSVGLFGGFDAGEEELFDFAKESFLKLPLKRFFGDSSGIALSNGRALLVNGTGDCEFDPATQKFMPLAKPFVGKFVRWAALLPLPDGKIFACGGYDTDFKPLGDCALYDPATRAFAPVGRLVAPRAHHSINLINGHQILVAGGVSASRHRTVDDSLEIFDLNTHLSTELPLKLQQARSSHASAALPDGRILLVGGSDPKHRPVALAELFDPQTGTLAAGGKLLIPRGDPLLAPLPSGRIAVFGGKDNVRLIEVYYPGEKRFACADQLMLNPRGSGFTVTPLPEGSCLLVGGRPNSGGEVLQAAELFREVRLPAPADQAPGVAELISALGAAQETARDEATRQLIALGPVAEAAVTPLLTNAVPEVRRRAEQIVTLLAAREEPPWCVEIKNQAGQSKTVWCSDYAVPRKNGELLSTIKDQIKAADDRLIVHFPASALPEQQARLFNAVGYLRTPLVFLGGALAPEEPK